MATPHQFDIDQTDIECLLEALDAWEKQAGHKAMMSTMLGMALIKDKAEAESQMKDEFAKADAETKSRKEQTIMLKAKLLLWRDRIEVDDPLVIARAEGLQP